MLFWGYFRLRPTPEEPSDEEQVELPAITTDHDLVVPVEAQPEPARVPVDSQGDTIPGSTPRVPRQQGPTGHTGPTGPAAQTGDPS